MNTTELFLLHLLLTSHPHYNRGIILLSAIQLCMWYFCWYNTMREKRYHDNKRNIVTSYPSICMNLWYLCDFTCVETTFSY